MHSPSEWHAIAFKAPSIYFRQADYVMLVGAGEDPDLGEYERLLLSMKTTARKELVLLHPDRSVIPGSTRAWLKVRTPVVSKIKSVNNLQLATSMDSPAHSRGVTCK